MSTNKKKPRGSEERIRTLDKACFSEAESIYQGLVKAFPRSQVAKDDILDALAAAVTGWLGTTEGKGKLAILPYDPPPKDCRGLPMEMVYCEPDAQSNPG